MTELLEEVERVEEPPVRIGHYASPTPKVALCGEPLLGITAYGEFVLCEDCARIKRETGFTWYHQDVPF